MLSLPIKSWNNRNVDQKKALCARFDPLPPEKQQDILISAPQLLIERSRINLCKKAHKRQ